MAIYPGIKAGGGNIEMAVESALGTPGSYADFRQVDDADPTFPVDTREVRPVSSKGYYDPTEAEPQITYEKAMENSGAVATFVSGCSSAAGTPQCVTLLQAAGCTVAVSGDNTADTLDGYTSTVAFSATSASSTLVAGTAGLLANLQTSPTSQWPFLVYSNSGAPNYNLVPTMAINGTSEASAELHKMWTVTPPKGAAVASTKTLAFRVSSYFQTDTESGSAFVYTGCAVSEIKPMVFESGSPLKLECGLHIADRAFDQAGIDLTAPTYTDAVAIPIIDGASRFLMGFADLGAYPQSAARTTGFRKATFNPGIKVLPVLETGATTSVNGWGGFIAWCDNPTIELVFDVDKEYWTHLEASGTQTAKYIELIQPSSATSGTAFGLWLPKCYSTGKPTAELWGDKDMTITQTFRCASANLAGTTKTAQGQAPWYFAVSPVH